MSCENLIVINQGSVVSISGKIEHWKLCLTSFRENNRFSLRKMVYKLLEENPGKELLNNPYVYIWSLNKKVYYVGYTSGGNENRGLAILSLLVPFRTAQHSGKDRCKELKVINKEDDILSISFIRTENVKMAKILERILIESLIERPPCNKD